MPRYRVFGRVVGGTYLGIYEAETQEAAEEMAINEAFVSLCHECSRSCEDPEVESVHSEIVDESGEDDS